MYRTPRYRLFIAFVLSAALCASAAAADVYLDPSFGSAGYRTVDFALHPYRNDALVALVQTPDGRIVTLGAVNTPLAWPAPPASRVGLARLTAAGALDRSFGGGDGRVDLPDSRLTPDGEFVPQALARQDDGKLVIAGSYAGDAALGNDFFVLRVLADGSGPDTSFGQDGLVRVGFDLGGGNQDLARAVAVQSDGRIVVAGSARVAAAAQHMAVLRLLPDGLPDSSFGSDGKVTLAFPSDAGLAAFDQVNALALQSDGKIVLAGSTANPSVMHPQWRANGDFALVRLRVNGVPDAFFGNSAPGRSRVNLYFAADDQATSLAVSELPGNPSGSRRIVLGGSSTRSGSTSMGLAAFDDDGNPDASFGVDGKRLLSLAPDDDPFLFVDSAIQAIAIQLEWYRAGPLLGFRRHIVVGGYALGNGSTLSSEFLLGRIAYAAGTAAPEFLRRFSADLDGDGVANACGVRAMAPGGNGIVAAGSSTLQRVDGQDSDFVIGRFSVD